MQRQLDKFIRVQRQLLQDLEILLQKRHAEMGMSPDRVREIQKISQGARLSETLYW